MVPSTLTLAVVLLLPAQTPGSKYADRQPNPLAPSLPQLTDEEEQKVDAIIDRFIQQDIGQLRGAEAKRAIKEFNALGSEAIPAMIRGINRAAEIESSCPAVLIAKKLASFLRTSTDPSLLEFARENIGAGVTKSKHMGVLKELRVMCMLRKNQLPKRPATLRTSPEPASRTSSDTRALRSMSVKELAEAIAKENGSRVRFFIAELERRKGSEALAALGAAAANLSDAEAKQFAREALERSLARQSSAVLKEKLKDERSEVRLAAARVVGNKKLRFGDELIELLSDENPQVVQAARGALVKLSGGTDHGPDAKADAAKRAEAVKKWKAWWAKQGGR